MSAAGSIRREHSATLIVPAVRTRQGTAEVFAFMVPGVRLLEIAEISRIGRDDSGVVSGFQRPEIRAHVKGITEYLDQGAVLFPNAVILALAPGVRFVASRGPKPAGAEVVGASGWLTIPLRTSRKAAWIVDGQQRALALAEVSDARLPVPVVAFISGDLAVHREQFILVNKARPLDRRLIDELLPKVGAVLPRDLAARRVPSVLCDALTSTPGSPFHNLVRRPSHEPPGAVVIDSALINLMRRSLQDPRGALAAHMGADGSPDLDAMYRTMVAYWCAVRDVFPEAWGLPPDRSRLMHAAGLTAMGVLMDQIMTRLLPVEGAQAGAHTVLERIAPHCRWTSGRWEALGGRVWNDVQCTTKDVRQLSNLLVALERDAARFQAAA